MPLDPQKLQAYIRQPGFQDLTPQEQVELFRDTLATEDERVGQLNLSDQYDVARQLLEYHTPGWGEKLGNLAMTGAEMFVPGVGGAIEARRRFQETGEVGPFASAIAAPFGGVQSELGATIAGGAADTAIFGLATLAGGAIAKPILKGLGLGTVATSKALNSAFSAAERVGALAAGEAARKAGVEAGTTYLRNHFVQHGVTNFTIGTAFGAFDAAERAMEGQDQQLLQDFFITPAGITALGLGLMGLQRGWQHFGNEASQKALAEFIGPNADRYADILKQGGIATEAVRKASGGTLDRNAAAKFVFDAVTGPLGLNNDVDLLKKAIKANPEMLQTELGLRILQTQRNRLFSPETTLDRNAAGVKVTFDGPGGRTETTWFPSGDTQISGALLDRMRKREILVTHLEGNERDLARYGQRFGVGVEPLDRGQGPFGTAGDPFMNTAGQYTESGPEPGENYQIMKDVEALQAQGMAFAEDFQHPGGAGFGPLAVQEPPYGGVGGPPAPRGPGGPEGGGPRIGPVMPFDPTVPPNRVIDPAGQKLIADSHVDFVVMPDGAILNMNAERHSRSFSIPPVGSPVSAAYTGETGFILDTNPLGVVTADFNGRTVVGPLRADGTIELPNGPLFDAPLTEPGGFAGTPPSRPLRKGVPRNLPFMRPYRIEPAPRPMEPRPLNPFTEPVTEFPPPRPPLPAPIPREQRGHLFEGPGAAAEKARLRNLVQPGQRIYITPEYASERYALGAPVPKESYLVLFRNGEEVTVKQGSKVAKTSMDTITEQLARGNASLLLPEQDFSKFLTATENEVRMAYEAQATGKPIIVTTTDEGLESLHARMDELNSQFDQRPSRLEAKAPTEFNTKLDKLIDDARKVPADEKTEGGSSTTKGCPNRLWVRYMGGRKKAAEPVKRVRKPRATTAEPVPAPPVKRAPIGKRGAFIANTTGEVPGFMKPAEPAAKPNVLKKIRAKAAAKKKPLDKLAQSHLTPTSDQRRAEILAEYEQLKKENARLQKEQENRDRVARAEFALLKQERAKKKPK